MNDGRSFFRRPKAQVLMAVLGLPLFYLLLVALSGGLYNNLLSVLVQSSLCLIFFIGWFVFFAQFILPVRTLSERWKLLQRIIFSYLAGLPIFSSLRGPAVFIKDGKVIQKIIASDKGNVAESQEKGPGVIWLDSASAAVLRTPVKYTRTVGPGIVFTRYQETIAGVVDLHTQRQALGPEGEEDPFGAKPSDLTDEKYKELQDRIRWSTSGLTRDGIEVIPSLAIIFKIDADEKNREGETEFGYNSDAVYKAVTSESINPAANQDSPHFHIPWNEIPAMISVDIWREYLRKFTLSQLFEPLSPESFGVSDPRTALQYIGDLILERLKTPEVKILDDFGRPTGQKAASREYRLIKDYGIKIIAATIRRVYFHPTIEDQLIHQWTANWLELARLEREKVEQKRSVAARQGQEAAQKQFALLSCQELIINPPEHPKEALETLLQDTLKGYLRNPSLYRRLSTEPQDLTELIQWLRGGA